MEKKRSYLNRREFLTASTAALASPVLIKASSGVLTAEAATRDEVKPSAEISADMVVIGSGASGLAAAVSASEKGVKEIVVLETLNVIGGNSVFAGGIFGAGSKVLEQKNTGMRMSKDEAFKTMMNSGRWRLNAPLVRALIDGSGETVDWLAEQGVDFGLMPSMGGNRPEGQAGGPPSREAQRAGSGGASSGGESSVSVKIGSAIVKALVTRGRELGIQFLTQTRAKRLIKDQSGRITGVLAEQKSGELKISTKSCIIATGGFAGNVQMMSKYLAPFQEGDDVFIGGIAHKGDGIQMAEEAGAGLEPRGATEFSVDRFHESPYIPFLAMKRSILSVNKKGERIPDNTNNVWRQPGKTVYLIFDEKMKQKYYQEKAPESDKKYFGTTPWVEKKGVLTDIWENAEKDLQAFSKKGKVKITNSWDEMAKWMGVSPDVLKGTIKEYNAGCDSGKDIYGRGKSSLVALRTPPYYAIRSCLNLLVTHGVIKTNKRMQVMDVNDDPIPGLYVAGDDIGGVDEDIYTGLGGHSIGFAATSGRLAGLNSASFIGME